MKNVYKSIEEYHPRKKSKLIKVFDSMIVKIISNEKLYLIVTYVFIRGRKLSISPVLLTQLDFLVLNDVRLNTENSFFNKTPNKRALANQYKLFI